MKLKITTRLEENGALIHIHADGEGLSARVRVPCHVRKLEDEKQREVLERYRQAAISKLLRSLAERVKTQRALAN